MDWSSSKLIRIEAGSVSVSTNDLRAMLSLYEVDDDALAAELLGLARNARERSWWHAYRTVVGANFRVYLGHEASATTVRVYQPTLVPGLLQTEEYARKVLEKSGAPREHLESLVDLRIERQERLAEEPAASRVFIFDESAIRKLVGGPDVMRRQLQHIKHVHENDPAVTLYVVPFDHGLHEKAHIPYVLLEFAGEEEMVLYLEHATGGGDLIVAEGPDEATGPSPAEYLAAFWDFVEELEQEPQTTPRLIDDALQRLG